MPDYSLADIAAATGNGNNGNNNGFGDGSGGWWILLLFILLGGFNNRGFGNGGYGAGGVGGNEIYPWLNQAQLTNDGFRDQMINDTINATHQSVNNLATQLCNCCSDMQMALANGFAGVEAGANARQIANMNQQFAAQTATLQGFNNVQSDLCNGFNGVQSTLNQGFNATQVGMLQGINSLQSQLASCCCDNQLAMANQTATILAENCADRAALSDGVRDIIANQTAGIQTIIDKLCDQELQAERRENDQLRQQLNMANLAASQNAQNALIQQGFANEVDALYNRLNTCPVPSTPVYGRTPIFTCGGCGCNNNTFIG